MKKIVFAVIFACVAFNAAISQFEGEPNSKAQHAVLMFANTRIAITNSFVMSATPKKDMHSFTQLPAGDLYYLVTGPRVQITLYEKSPAGSFATFSASDFVIDSSAKDKTTFYAQHSQYRVSVNRKSYNGWQNCWEHPFWTSQRGQNFNAVLTLSYSPIDTTLHVNDSMVVEFRDQVQKPLLTIHINRIDAEKKPFLSGFTEDSSASQPVNIFVQQQVTEWAKKAPSFDSFYAYWPTGLQLYNQQFFPSSKLAFYFVRPPQYQDSTLEYKLAGGEYADTAWHLSGYLIIVPHLQSNSNYALLVRYKNYPANVSTYTFYVPPMWYQKRAIVYFVFYPLAFFIVFFTTIYFARLRLKKANEKKAKLALELKSIRAQLNPHFVFNALSSIQALINKNEVDLANQYLTDFSNLLRTSLQSHDRDLVPVAMDLKTLENYIKLEQLRFNFYYDIKKDEQLNLNSIEIPSLLLQPLIENAIKHGISLIKENGRLLIEYIKKEHAFIIRITDNGRGFNTQEISGDKFGLRLTKERILLLNKTFKQQPIIMNIVSNTNGTCVTLTFNHWL